MAAHDYVIANGTGAAVRSDLNNALAAIVSNNSGSSEPGTTYAYQWWADTNANVLKIRNSSNDGWITLRELDGTMLIEDGSAASPGLAFADDTNTGLFSSAENTINFSVAAAERLEIGQNSVVINDPGDDVDFRVESDGKTHMLFVDAGNDRIGIGTSSPAATLNVIGDSYETVLLADGATDSSTKRFGINCAHYTNSEEPFAIIQGASSGSQNVLHIGGNDSSTTANNATNIRFYTSANQTTTSGGESARIDSSGRLLVGTSSAVQATTNALLQLKHADGPQIILARDDSTLTTNEDIGTIRFYGNDGGSYQECARIAAEADDNHANDDKPTALRFYTTADGASSPTERLRIDSSGRLLIGASADIAGTTAAKLQVVNVDSQAEIVLGRNDQTISTNNTIGAISFFNNDNSGYQNCAVIRAKADDTFTDGDKPTRLEFLTTADNAGSPTERARITSSGNFLVGTDSNTEYSLTRGSVNVGVASSLGNQHALKAYVTNTSFSETGGGIKFTGCRRSSSSAWSFGGWYSGNGSTSVATDKEFSFRGDGHAFADESWNGGGADYAEYFEWSDGNTSDEDRRGISVVLDGDKIREAVAGEEPIGVISGNPSVVGDADIDRWKGKYLRDDYGTHLLQTHNVVKWNETVTDEDGNESIKEHDYEDWNLPEGIVVPGDAVVSAVDDNGKPFTHKILNPDYNPDTAYISREDRPEWSTVGLMGKLRIRKGQITGARWIKMRDVSDTVEEWLVR